MVAKRGLAVYSGSAQTEIHKFIDDGDSQIGQAADDTCTVTGLIDITGDLTASSNISASYFLGDGSKLKNIVATADVNVDDSTADTNFQLVGVAAAGDSATLITDDTREFTFNPSTKLLRLPGDASLLSDAAELNFGADSDVKFTHVADTGLLLNSTMAIQFNDASQYIKASSAADLDLAATTDINLDCTTVDVNGAIDVSGVSTLGSTTGATVSAAGLLNINNATEATSATDGSLQTDGGLSVVRSAVIGDDLDLLSNSAVFKVGSDQPFTLTHSNANNTLLATTNHRLAFGDAADYIAGDGTDLKIVSSGDVDITGDTDVVGGLSSTQATTLASAAGATAIGSTTAVGVTAAGIVNVNNATDATSKTDGSLQTDGGLSVAKAIYNGTAATLAADSGVVTIGAATSATFSAAGLLNINNATEATSATDGSLQTDGGLSVVRSAVIGDDLDLLSDGAILNIGSTSKFTLTDQAANNCVMAASGARLAFGNAGEYITGDGTDLAIVSSGDVDITGDTDVVGGLSSTQATTLASSAGVTTIGATTGATVSAAGLLNINNATEATSATDGSLQTDGGLSVVRSAVIGDDLDLLSDGAILNIGSTSKFTLTDQAANNCVMAASGARLAFGNAGEYLTGDGTDLAIVSSGDLNVTATTAAITGDLTVSGDSTLGDANADVSVVSGSMKLSMFDGTDATDQATLRAYCTSSVYFQTPTTQTPATQWNGHMIYVGNAYAGEGESASGSDAKVFFDNEQKWYFCESGSWYPSPFNS